MLLLIIGFRCGLNIVFFETLPFLSCSLIHGCCALSPFMVAEVGVRQGLVPANIQEDRLGEENSNSSQRVLSICLPVGCPTRVLPSVLDLLFSPGPFQWTNRRHIDRDRANFWAPLTAGSKGTSVRRKWTRKREGSHCLWREL